MSAEVGAWEPGGKLDEAHAQALDRASRSTDGAFAIDDANCLREVVRASAGERARLFDGRESERLLGWLRALTLAEETIAGCEAGAKSPVIALARLLRQRGDYPADLTAWIKSVSGNRFLPYGSLMERLKG